MSRVNPRLAGADSPYLEEAAEQPVDWRTWSQDAFDEAQDQGKPVLVDSGAVWCHWCHVMDHESYEDPDTAELINERFVPIKLDRDERPDVDKRLQQAVGAITGQGGWPLTAFLTPQGDVFYGGTYFPPEPARGMPAFQDVLEQVANFWDDDPESARDQAHRLNEALDQTQPSQRGALTMDTVEDAIDQALGSYDAAHGGFETRPKFPHPTTLDLLLEYAHARPDDDRSTPARKATLHTLEAMSQGGLFDHLEGGFHRYSVDERWHVPHFEKMLYDNALLLATLSTSLTHAARTDAPEHDALKRAAQGTIQFLGHVLQRPEGGFGGSQDADRRPDEDGPLRKEDLDDGGYFTWTLDEVNDLLDDEQDQRIARLHYGLTEDGDMPDTPGQNVLRIDATAHDIAAGMKLDQHEVRERIQRIQRTLREARTRRKTPLVDPTVYTDWNGLAIAALLQHGLQHDHERALELGLDALDRILEDAWDPQTGYHHALREDTARVTGLVDDHVQMIPALIEAYHATQDASYLDHAQRTGEMLLERFLDDGTLRFNADQDDPAPQGDSPTPSPGAQAALHLPRLARLTGEDVFENEARTLLERLAPRADRLAAVHGGTLHKALLAHKTAPAHVVVTGEDATLWETAVANRSPLATVRLASDPDEKGVPEAARKAADAFQNEPAAVVCRGQACQVFRDPDRLRDALLG